MFRIFLISFLLNFYIFASNFETTFQATVEAEPSVMLEGCVNLMTGQLYLNNTDIVAEGKEPIFYSKSYTSMFSGYALEDIFERWSECEDARNEGWGSHKHIMAYIGYDTKRKKDEIKRIHRRADIHEPNGVMLSFDFPVVKPPKDNFFESKKKKKEKKKDFENRKRETRILNLIENHNFYQKGIVNAKDNYKNTQVIACGEHDLRVKSSNNTIRHYYRKDAAFEPYNLQWEILPNGNRLEYIVEYDELKEIRSKSPTGKIYAWLKLNKSYLKNKLIYVGTNNDKTIKYAYRKENIKDKKKKEKTVLRYKISPYGEELFQYHKNKCFLLKNCIYPNNRLFQIEYHDNKKGFKKVAEIKTSFGKTQDLRTIYWIHYEKAAKLNDSDGQTTVIDANGNETKYFFSNKLRLQRTERFENINGQNRFKNAEAFIWQDNGFLLAKIYFNESNQPIKAVKNIYNVDGNIIKKITYGNITGKCNIPIQLDHNQLPIDNGVDTYVQDYAYCSNNLISSEIDQNSYRTEYSYLSMSIEGENFVTNLPLTKFIIFEGEIKKRYFYTYDSDNILIEEIEDDGLSRIKEDLTGVTTRIIKRIEPRTVVPFGLIDTLKEYYYDKDEKTEKLLKKEIYEYSKSCKVVRKHIFGSDENFEYTINYEYDPVNDNLLSATDPLGRQAHYHYDKNHNTVYEKTFDNKEIYCEYDLCNKLISKTIKDNEQSYVEEYEYDGKHNKISIKDFDGNITRFNYDSFGNVIEEILPKVEYDINNISFPKKSYEYDALFRQIKKTDANGNSTIISYNIFNEPIKIEYPDHSIEEFEYNLDGTLKHHIDQIKTKTEYQYDCFKRVISKKIISSKDTLLSEEFFEYDAFNLISYTDPEGNITKYTYDGAKRKIKEEIYSKDQKLLSKEEFFYDELGFLYKRVKADSLLTIYIKDALGRILEKQQKDINENYLRKIQYRYDDQQNKKITISYVSTDESIETETFDTLDRLIKVEDGLNNVTTYIYDNLHNQTLNQKEKRITSINPLNQKTIKIFDSLGREKIIENVNPLGQTLSYEQKFYDNNNNLIKQISSIYIEPGKISKTIITKWKYDEMNRLLEIIEAYDSNNEKITKYSYTDKGQIEKIIKPDQNILFYEYDSLGNNTKIYSLKKDIDYYFEYNKLNQIVLAKDFNNFITKRKYDLFGNILEENLSNNLSISNEYDFLNNKIKTTFQDASYVEYKYDPLNLKEIIRKDKDGFELYKHEYLKYDLSGNLLKENLILNSTNVDYSIDKLSRLTKIESKFHHQKAVYDAIGRMTDIHCKDFKEDSSSYSYDDLNQVIGETGRFSNNYLFDSHNNRISKNNDSYHLNDLNQINQTSDFRFEYDKNGNLTKKTFKDFSIFYEYDSLDRLVKIEKPSCYILEFQYDPFNRRISKYTKYASFFKFDDYKLFLYDDQNEIGSFDQYYNPKELRILSTSKNAEIASAISFEIDGYIYAPIYDVSGNVTSLIYNDSLYEHYRYSAFGERKIFSQYGYEIKKSSINNPWQFSSKRIDEDSNLIYYGRRYYDPTIGRWLTCDPKGFINGFNLYAFVLNNPLTQVDLYGLMFLPIMFQQQEMNTGHYSDIPLSAPQKIFSLNEFAKNTFNTLFGASQLASIILHKDYTREININPSEFSDGRNIGVTFGIRTNSQEAKEYAKMISNYAGGKNIHLLHNETRGLPWDGLRAYYELYFHLPTKSVRQQKEIWTNYLNNSNKNYFHICQSEGAIITRNALEGMPENLRKRIEVVAIAPAAYINRNLCNSRVHYVSRDFVPYFDIMGYLRNKDSVVKITSHPGAKLHDHNFDSPSYEEFLLKRIENYTK